jgi:hypothetical protein
MARPLRLAEGEIRRGEPVLLLHFWNEHMPSMPVAGPDLLWARHTSRLLIRSFQLVALRMQQDYQLAGVRAVGGVTVLIPTMSANGDGQLLQRLGFVASQYQNPLGRFGEFWENCYSWLLMWAYNPSSLRNRSLFTLRRCEVWMAAETFLQRYG